MSNSEIAKAIIFLINLERGLRTGPHLIRRVGNGIEPMCLSMHILIANEALDEPYILEELRGISAALMQHLMDQVSLRNLNQPLCVDLADLLRSFTNILELLH